MNLLSGQHIVVVGLGESGLACASWVLAQGATLTVFDTRENPPGLTALKEIGQAFSLVSEVDEVDSFQRLIVSPGLPPHHPDLKALVNKARSSQAHVGSELDLFAEAIEALKTGGYQPKIVGITGTNGKTTTVRMTECMASQAGFEAIAAGNISPASLAALQTALELKRLPKIWVLELSSFQLHWTSRLQCDAATVLNISQDHLDWHSSAEEYRTDKLRIFSPAAVAVINRDNPVLSTEEQNSFSRRCSFGLDEPKRAGDFGLVYDGGIQWLAQAVSAAEPVIKRGKVVEPEQISIKLLMPTEVLKVIGLHNVSNALAALALCSSVGLPMAGLLHGLRQFEGEPHRVSFVQQVDGVDFIDDSKGTNVGATVAALTGLAKPCVLIAGGDGKGQSFTELKAPIKQYCKAVLTIGKDGPAIQREIDGLVRCEQMASLEAAVERAFELAGSGEMVLLSPACASLDMFKNYAHRAEVFVEAVKELAMSRGQVC